MKAFILAAGYGKRLRPLTETTPKPLLTVNDKPLIHYHLEKLASLGVTEVVINAHWLADKLIDALGDGSAFGLNISWSVEERLLETGGGIRNALDLLGDDTFLLINGDVYIDYSFDALLSRTLGDSLAHLVLVPNPSHHPAGDFCRDSDGKIYRKEGSNDFTYAGVALIDPKLVRDWRCEDAAFPLLSPLLEAMEQHLLAGDVHTGLWEDVGTLDRLEALDQKLRGPQE
ncbi:UNVERIFIED_CONTAM: hypothetical protein GTU68_044728 [Idotea baltica]|nr:hypothetical protein [Idotea baltica]